MGGLRADPLGAACGAEPSTILGRRLFGIDGADVLGGGGKRRHQGQSGGCRGNLEMGACAHARNLVQGPEHVKIQLRNAEAGGGAHRPPLPLTLTGFEALLRLVDDIDAALAAHDAVVAVTRTQGLEGVSDFHDHTN